MTFYVHDNQACYFEGNEMRGFKDLRGYNEMYSLKKIWMGRLRSFKI